MATKLTRDQWYLAMSTRGPAGVQNLNSEEAVVRILTMFGCRRIEPLGDGAAQARIPQDWASQVEAEGSATIYTTATVNGLAHEVIIEVDLP